MIQIVQFDCTLERDLLPIFPSKKHRIKKNPNLFNSAKRAFLTKICSTEGLQISLWRQERP